jgi:phospholipid transport system transporter-binding protein
MPTSSEATTGVTRDGDTLVFSGTLSRDAVASLWPRALASIAGVRRFSLEGVPSLDSAGLALLAELAARAGGGVAVTGAPLGLAVLRSAYRLDPSLAFAAA